MKTLNHMGVDWTFKVSSEGLCVAEQVLPHGMAPPVHTHTREDEAWMVLDGELTFHLAGDLVRAVPGDVVFGPRDVPHTFVVESEQARLLTIIAPGVLEQFFHETGGPPPGPETLVAKMHEYGVAFVAPPPAPRAG